MANEQDYVELGLFCADICRALDRKQLNGQLSVRPRRVQTSLDKNLEPSEGTIRTPPIVSGRGYDCLRTAAHLGSRRFDRLVRKQSPQVFDAAMRPSNLSLSAPDLIVHDGVPGVLYEA